MRTFRRSAAVTALLATATLGAGCAARPVAARPSSAGQPPGPAAGREPCADLTRLTAGAVVPAWRLGAVHFLSATVGVALTAPRTACAAPGAAGSRPPSEFLPQPVRFAVTADGGLRWVTRGPALASTGQSSILEQVTATSTSDAWALTDRGQLLATSDGGVSWTRQPGPGPVVSLASAGGSVWALACPSATAMACRPMVERAARPGGAWRVLPFPRLPAQPYPLLALASAGDAMVVTTRPGGGPGTVASTADGGAHWAWRPAPRGPRRLCSAYTGLTASRLSAWWLMCAGGYAAGSATQALLRSADGGRTWRTSAAVTSLAAPPTPGGLPSEDSGPVAAGPPGTVWLAMANGLAGTRDGGAIWTTAPGVTPLGILGSFDVLSPRRAWYQAPGVGLWRTSGGTSWRPVGPVVAP